MKQRQLAQRALASVEEMAQNTSLNSKYKTLCMKSPSLLAQSGLAQSITFLRARERRKDMSGEKYLEHVVKVLKKDGISGVDALQQRALSANLKSYMELTQSVQDAMIWLRRFAQVEMANIQEDHNSDED